MMQSNPTLVQSSDRASNGDFATRMDGLKLDGTTPTLTYVPSDPRATYRELLSRCLDWDLEVLKSLPEDEDVSLGVLSPDHVSLLGECALRWRMGLNFRAWVFLDAIVERCERSLVPAACVHEASAGVQKMQAEMPLSTWAEPDVGRDISHNIDISSVRVWRRPQYGEMSVSSQPSTMLWHMGKADITPPSSKKRCPTGSCWMSLTQRIYPSAR